MSLTLLYFFAELIGGTLTHSVALLADAGHMLTDFASLGLALFAAWLAEQPSGSQKTFGYYRLEILTAFINGLTLLLLALWIVYEAGGRFANPTPILGKGMLLVAFGGLLINIVAAWLLHADQTHNMNVRGAYLHILGDLLGSVGTIVAAGLILLYGWTWADPLISIFIAAMIAVSAWRLIKESAHILLEFCPPHIAIEAVETALSQQPGVKELHDLHVWTIGTGRHALSAHVVVDEGHYGPQVLSGIHQMINQRFGIGHMTIQLETHSFREGHADSYLEQVV